WLLAEVAAWHDWDLDVAEEHVRAALALEDHHAEATMTSALIMNARGQGQEALAAAAAAVHIDPLGPGNRVWFVATAFNVGAFEVCRDEGTRLIAEHPDFGQAYSWRAMAHLVLGDVAKARADAALARSVANTHAWDERCEAVVASQMGDERPARATLERY